MTELDVPSKHGAAFDFTAEEALKALGDASANARSDRRVCKCGHAARFHASESTRADMQELAKLGHNRCTPGRQLCPCDNFAPVMIVADVRRFMARTDGPGAQHALAKGAITTWNKGDKAVWMDHVECDGCHRNDVHLTPVAYTDRYTEATYPTKHNMLVCADCRQRIAEQPKTV